MLPPRKPLPPPPRKLPPLLWNPPPPQSCVLRRHHRVPPHVGRRKMREPKKEPMLTAGVSYSDPPLEAYSHVLRSATALHVSFVGRWAINRRHGDVVQPQVNTQL